MNVYIYIYVYRLAENITEKEIDSPDVSFSLVTRAGLEFRAARVRTRVKRPSLRDTLLPFNLPPTRSINFEYSIDTRWLSLSLSVIIRLRKVYGDARKAEFRLTSATTGREAKGGEAYWSE